MTVAVPVDEDYISLHEGFVELEELSCSDDKLVWKETARWIKFEEDVEENANRWGKPHIPCLGFKSCREVRTVFENGSFLLDLEEDDLPSIAEAVVETLFGSEKLQSKEREAFLSVLLTPHQHQFQKKKQHGFSRKLSTIVPLHRSASTLPRKRNPSIRYNDLMSVSEEGISTRGPIEGVPKVSTLPATSLSKPIKDNLEVDSALQRQASNIETRISKNAEATTVLVGGHTDISSPVGAFVRLARGCNLGNLAEVKIPVRFLFILLGPQDESINYHEIGRCVATLMSDQLFLECAYDAQCLGDLLEAMDAFLADTVIIPPGEWDRNVLSQTIPSLADQTKKTALRRRGAILKRKRGVAKKSLIPESEAIEVEEDTLSRTGRFCGGLVRDAKRRFSAYRSDITDSFNWRCVLATILVYLACLAPAISFGGLLYEYTDGWMGVAEIIVSTALSGIIFALFAGQPLIIIGATGPLLVFEKNTYDLCMWLEMEYLPWRAWVGIWVMVICFCVVAFEGCFLIRYFTRFTEEIFACLISVIFVYDGFSYLDNIFQKYPLGTGSADTVNGKYVANTALLATILLCGTFLLAHTVRQIRHSSFFGHATRRIISDFGVLIAIIAMVLLDLFASKVFIPKLMVPDGFDVTSPSKRGWLVNPMGEKTTIPTKHIFSALIPAILVSFLVFMEVEFCNVILDKKNNKLKKGPGYNLDLFVVGLLTGLDSILGLPWMCATPVHTVSHFHALMVFSSNHAPGEHAHLEEVKEQRVTNVVIHILIGVTVFLSPVLRLIPVAVLFGVFVYLGISSLSHLELCERIKLLIIPPNNHPDKSYVRNVPTFKMHCFTLLQVILLLFLIAIKVTVLAPAFPFFIICLIPLRRFIERYYTPFELEELDNEEEAYDSDMDEFDSVHVPI